MGNELVPSFGETLFNTNFDMTVDYLDQALDLIVDNGMVQEIPIVKTVVSIGKTVVAVRDRNLLKKTLEFVKTVNSGEISDEKRQDHYQKVKNNDKKMKAELEHILLMLDKFIDGQKSVYLAKFYIEYIKGECKWKDFFMFSEFLDIISIYDLEDLAYMYKYKYLVKENVGKVNAVSLYRLSSIYLVQHFSGSVISIDNYKNVVAKITDVGESFYEVLIS